MRAVIQRVRSAEVRVGEEVTGKIGHGLLILLGVEARDQNGDAEWTAQKTLNLRIFEDAEGVMNRSVLESGGGLLIVSQFTLLASTRKGNRPSYQQAARPEIAVPLYEWFVARCREWSGREVATGRFGADMQVHLVNDGPVTILLDSHLRE
ncbi:MAG: D-aminoacyl-tRNA deacylase [Candidatus Methylacidiphilales bacterium]|nr:D-aminoacyl-tRNA deacylase [Candidatus Methylacidiphilales bacterium]